MLIVDHRTPSGEVLLYDGVDGVGDNPVSSSISNLVAKVSHTLTQRIAIEDRVPAIDHGYLTLGIARQRPIGADGRELDCSVSLTNPDRVAGGLDSTPDRARTAACACDRSVMLRDG
jgi:hypothetical protein